MFVAAALKGWNNSYIPDTLSVFDKYVQIAKI